MKLLFVLITIFLFVSNSFAKKVNYKELKEKQENINTEISTLFRKLVELKDTEIDKNNLQYVLPYDLNEKKLIINKFNPIKLSDVKIKNNYLSLINAEGVKLEDALDTSIYLIGERSFELFHIYKAIFFDISKNKISKETSNIAINKILNEIIFHCQSPGNFISTILRVAALRYATDLGLFPKYKKLLLELDYKGEEHRKYYKKNHGPEVLTMKLKPLGLSKENRKKLSDLTQIDNVQSRKDLSRFEGKLKSGLEIIRKNMISEIYSGLKISSDIQFDLLRIVINMKESLKLD